MEKLVTDSSKTTLPPLDAFDFLWMELTPHCNLRCVHCYADSGPLRPLREQMHLEDWMETLRQAGELGCRSVQFIGGEPTLYPGLSRLIQQARALNFQFVEVFTNGTALSDKLRQTLVRYKVSLAFSIYASQADVHDRITGQKGSFAKTVASIQWALSAGLGVRGAIVAMEANSGHVEPARHMLKGLGVSSIRVDRIRGIGRGSREVAPESLLKELCGTCGRGQLCASSDGQVYPCVFSHFCPVGNMREGLGAAIRGKKLSTFRETMRSMRSQLRVRGDLVSACNPEEPAGPCGPEEPAGPCGPEEPAGPCGPEKPVGPCDPELPSICHPEEPA